MKKDNAIKRSNKDENKEKNEKIKKTNKDFDNNNEKSSKNIRLRRKIKVDKIIKIKQIFKYIRKRDFITRKFIEILNKQQTNAQFKKSYENILDYLIRDSFNVNKNQRKRYTRRFLKFEN